MTITLPGIDVVSIDETCTAPDGAAWPCGKAARTAFRAYLRSRALNCQVPWTSAETAIVTDCLLFGDDPALWLVANGWARAKPGGPFASQGELAERSGKGIFGNPPR
jgi:endonuclease YncB( thermonuclease family)